MSSTTCPVCEETFSAPGSLRDHAWDAHDACHYCGDQFRDEETLYTHWLATHADELSRSDHKRAKSEVGSLAFTDRLTHQGVGAAVGGLRRRTLLLAGGAAVAGSAAVVGTTRDRTGGTARNGTRGAGTGGQTNAVATARIPSSPDEYRYAVTGTANAGTTVTYFGSWKCPYCAQFSTGFLPTLIADYVETGEITLEFRNLTYIDGEPFLGADAPAAARAGLAVWNNDPKSYWGYHEQVLSNQPPESKQWATADKLMSFARTAGVADPSVIQTAIQENRYEDSLRATSAAAKEAGIRGTPTLLVDGTTVNPFEEGRTRRLIEDAIA